MEMRINLLKMLECRDKSRHAEILPLDTHCPSWRGMQIKWYNMVTMWSALRLGFWLLILVLALSFFGISIQAIVNSPAGQANFGYLYNLLSQIWQWLVDLVT